MREERNETRKECGKKGMREKGMWEEKNEGRKESGKKGMREEGMRKARKYNNRQKKRIATVYYMVS